jgi:hypothetical protein
MLDEMKEQSWVDEMLENRGAATPGGRVFLGGKNSKWPKKIDIM